MKMSKLVAAVIVITFTAFAACKGRKSDTEIQAAVAEKIGTIPGVMADTKDGVVTLSGVVAEDSLRTSAETMTKSTDGVTSVVNSITVSSLPTPAPQSPVDTTAVAISPDTSLKSGVETIIKDFPGANATVQDGVITITGTLAAGKWKTLKMSLDALKPKKVDASGLQVKS